MIWRLHEIISGIKTSQKQESIDDYIDLMILWYRDILNVKSYHGS